MAIHNARDNSFKLILGNHQLFVEFLRDYLNIDLLKDVQPEDIEDMSERFLPLFQDNQDSDTVKRINLKGEPPIFVIALLEHESKVNFRSSFKMFQYICLILDNYEKEINKEQEGASAKKGFRYPPVLPIVFYDGTDPWTAELNFLDRTALNQVFQKYIPKFEYLLVDLNRYAPEDLVRFGDALSLIMLIDKLETWDGESLLNKMPPDYLERMALKIPKELTRLITDVMSTLLNRLKFPEEETRTVTNYFTGKEERGMFEHVVEKVLEDRRRAREEGKEEGEKVGKEEKALEAARNFLGMGLSPEQVAKGTGLDLATVKNISLP
ncbi:Rpn family recombination-promoting nuclease/putative transposase [Treponema primitia]|uniref:Rpn family recombination-promoting nuclease/putative transposase n=1 Tax=Treponema primitia TaxID=88058 RepID=UPI0002554E88|nr:Rpn family recombination-promoting nuclease/putative transposase [Treponema primitia]